MDGLVALMDDVVDLIELMLPLRLRGALDRLDPDSGRLDGGPIVSGRRFVGPRNGMDVGGAVTEVIPARDWVLSAASVVPPGMTNRPSDARFVTSPLFRVTDPPAAVTAPIECLRGRFGVGSSSPSSNDFRFQLG